jgi:hypothetical protein
LLTLALVGFGLVGSISAALGSGSGIGKTLAIVAGALVASLTTINQVWSPASRSEAYRVGYGAMRDEGWDFVLERGAYEQFKTKTGLERAAFDTFSQRITQIDRRARDVEQPGDVAAGRR